MVAGYYGDDKDHKEPLAAFTLDVKSAHKRIKLHPKEHGDQFIQTGDRLFYYKTCHFGGAWSAWWWARTASALMRLIHRLVSWPPIKKKKVFICLRPVIQCHLCFHVGPMNKCKIAEPHFSVVYVDDFIVIAPESRISELSALVQLFLAAVGCPMSWHKTCVGGTVEYLGFTVNVRDGLIGIPANKLQKASTFLDLVKKGNHICFREIEKGRGRLLWFTWIAQPLRPWLAPFFSCCKDLRWGDKIRVSGQLEKVAAFWKSALKHASHRLHECKALRPAGGCGAADACASGRRAAIGGWWSHSEHPALGDVYWFRMELWMHDLPDWLQAQVSANQRIAFFELLAQAALIFLRLRQSPGVAISQRFEHKCDNMASVGAVEKYFTTKPPLCFALQALAYHAAHTCSAVQVSHIPGVKNTLADHISRWIEHPETIAKLDERKEIRDFSLRDILGPVWDLAS